MVNTILTPTAVDYSQIAPGWFNLAKELRAKASPPRSVWNIVSGGLFGQSVQSNAYASAFIDWYDVSSALLKWFFADPSAEPSIDRVFAVPCLFYFHSLGPNHIWNERSEGMISAVEPVLPKMVNAMRFVEQAHADGSFVMNYLGNLRWLLVKPDPNAGPVLKTSAPGFGMNNDPMCLIGRMARYPDDVTDRPVPLRPGLSPVLYFNYGHDGWSEGAWFQGVAKFFGYCTVFNDDSRGIARKFLLEDNFGNSYIRLLDMLLETDFSCPGVPWLVQSLIDGKFGPFREAMADFVETSEHGSSRDRHNADYWIGNIIATNPDPTVLEQALPSRYKFRSEWISYALSMLSHYPMTEVDVAMARLESIYRTVKRVFGFDFAKSSMKTSLRFEGKGTALDHLGTIKALSMSTQLPVEIYRAMFDFVIRRGSNPSASSPEWKEIWTTNAKTALAEIKGRFAASVSGAVDDMFVGQ